jgi:glycosyltransferase involved in cell wall biosynthesis
MLTIVTTCKNRLPHLKQTLPGMIKQSSSEVIVVDYGCEQGTAAWVAEAFSAVKVVRVDDDSDFCAARARNIGAKHATTGLLCFVDADVILNIDLGKWLEENYGDRKLFLSGDNRNPDLVGFAACSKELFERVGGYDEAFRGWGGEDRDLYERLEFLGLEIAFIPDEALTPIKHGDEIRQLATNQNLRFSTKQQAVAFNQCYRLIKLDIQKLVRFELDFKYRNALRENLFTANVRAIAAGKREFVLTIDLAPEPKRNNAARAGRKLIYTVPVYAPF